MIDTPTAWAILSTPLGIAAGLGWMHANERYQWALKGWKRACDLHRYQLDSTRDAFKAAQDRAIDAEDRLRRIERQRSESTRKGNLTRSAKRKALQASTTAQLERAVAAKTDRAAA